MKKRKPLSLSKAFADLEQCPARRFEVANNMRGIAGHYKIPDGHTAQAYESLLRKRIDRECRPLMKDEFSLIEALIKNPPPACLRRNWKKLIRLNPELEKIKMEKENGLDLFNAVLGVVSGFNIDDINFFIEQDRHGKGAPALQSRLMPDHGERLARIEFAARSSLYWVCSPATAQKIESRLMRRGLIDRNTEFFSISQEYRLKYIKQRYGWRP